MMLQHARFVVFVATLALALPVPTVQAAGVATPKSAFVPHRALYTMALGHSLRGSNVSDATGKMFYRFEPLCDGWEVESRIFMRLHFGSAGDEEVVETTWSFTSFESYDGQKFTFEVEHDRNGELQEIFAGEADKDAGGGTATFDNDEAFFLDLPARTAFPGEHLMQLLAEARNGRYRISRTVFDGASKNNPYEVNAIIIGPVVGGMLAHSNARSETSKDKSKNRVLVGATLPAPATGIPPSPVWRMRLAYFPLSATDELPEFEIEVDYREDGIAERMVQDFGDFTLNLSPSRIEVLPASVCK
ncbi:MAG: DUF1849 family protein [Rhodospirillales bacterium]